MCQKWFRQPWLQNKRKRNFIHFSSRSRLLVPNTIFAFSSGHNFLGILFRNWWKLHVMDVFFINWHELLYCESTRSQESQWNERRIRMKGDNTKERERKRGNELPNSGKRRTMKMKWNTVWVYVKEKYGKHVGKGWSICNDFSWTNRNKSLWNRKGTAHTWSTEVNRWSEQRKRGRRKRRRSRRKNRIIGRKYIPSRKLISYTCEPEKRSETKKQQQNGTHNERFSFSGRAAKYVLLSTEFAVHMVKSKCYKCKRFTSEFRWWWIVFEWYFELRMCVRYTCAMKLGVHYEYFRNITEYGIGQGQIKLTK